MALYDDITPENIASAQKSAEGIKQAAPVTAPESKLYTAAREATSKGVELGKNIIKGAPGVSTYEAYHRNDFAYSPIAQTLAHYDPTGAMDAMSPAMKATIATGESLAWLASGEAMSALGETFEGAAQGVGGALKKALHMAGLAKSPETAGSQLAAALTSEKLGSSIGEEELSSLAASAARGKTIARVASAGAVGGVFGAAQTGLEAAQGQQPHLASNLALNTLLSAAFGLYSPGTSKRVMQHAEALHGLLTETDKDSIAAVNSLAGHMQSNYKLSPSESVRTILKVSKGGGTDTERQLIGDAIAANPKLAQTAFGKRLMKAATAPASPEYELNDETPNFTFFDTQNNPHNVAINRNNVEHYAKMSAEGRIQPQHLAGPQDVIENFEKLIKGYHTDFSMPEQQANKMMDSLETGSFHDGVFAGQKGVLPRAVENKPAGKFSDIVVALPDGQQIQIGEPTLAGTPVAAPGVEAIVPAGVEPATGIPDVPTMRQPATVKGVDKTILDAATGADAAAFEKTLSGSKATTALKRLVTNDILKPSDITDIDMARTIGSRLQDMVPEFREGSPKYAQVYEKAMAFTNRAFELKGEAPPAVWTPELTGMMLRSADAGDIVRKIDNEDGTVSLVDRRGTSVILRDSDAPPVVPQTIENIPEVDLSNLDNAAESTKKLEATMGDGDITISSTRARRGLRPSEHNDGINDLVRLATLAVHDPGKIAILKAKLDGLERTMPKVEFERMKQQLYSEAGKLAPARAPEYETGIEDAMPTDAMPREQKAAWQAYDSGQIDEEELNRRLDKEALTPKEVQNAAAKLKMKWGLQEKPNNLSKKVDKILRGYSKGAVSIPRGTRVTDGLIASVASKHGGEVWSIPEGFLVKQGPYSYRFNNAFDLLDFYNKFNTHQRIAAEQEQAFAKDDIRLPSLAALSPLFDTANKLAKEESSRKPGILKYKKGALGVALRRQIAVLDSMGKGGRWLATMANHYYTTMEIAIRADQKRIYAAVRQIKKLGGTVRNIETRTADSRVMALWDKAIKPVLDSHYQNAQVFGIAGDEVVGKVYVPHIFEMRGTDISDHALAEIREKMDKVGVVIDDADHAARILEDPERFVEQSSRRQPERNSNMVGPKARQADQQELVRWLRQKAAYVAGSLQKNRKGGQEYINDIDRALDRAIRSRNRRLAEAAVFGPNLERADAALSQIGGNGAFMTEQQMMAQKILNDIRGRTYNPVSRFQVGAMDLARGSLVLSAPRHLSQLAGLAARSGVTRTSWAALQEALHPLRNRRIASDIAVSLDHTRFVMTEEGEAGEKATEGVLDKFAKAWGAAGSWPLHKTIDTIRRIGMNVGFNEFDRLHPKALMGHSKSLALMSEVLQTKVTPDMLATMDKSTLRNMYAKNLADWTGFTFRPQDMPQFARSNMGRFLLQFRSYMWQSTANWFNMLTNPNIPKSVRAGRAARSLVLVPAVSILSAKLYQKVGGETINSLEALKAWDDFQKSPFRELVNLELESAINIHLLGVASDLIQGLNTADPQLADRALQLSPASASLAVNALFAAPFAYEAMMTGDPKMKEAAYNHAASIFGLGGVALNRKAGRTKPVRLPKHNIVAGR